MFVFIVQQQLSTYVDGATALSPICSLLKVGPNLWTLVYKASGLSTTPWRLLLQFGLKQNKDFW